jgi:hypothetical protein
MRSLPCWTRRSSRLSRPSIPELCTSLRSKVMSLRICLYGYMSMDSLQVLTQTASFPESESVERRQDAIRSHDSELHQFPIRIVERDDGIIVQWPRL